MKFRRNCFGIFSLLVLIIAIAWVATGLSASDTPTETEAEEAGQTIGQGIGVTLILCITIPLFGLLALLSWRNDVGLKTERRHQEQLDAVRQQQK